MVKVQVKPDLQAGVLEVTVSDTDLGSLRGSPHILNGFIKVARKEAYGGEWVGIGIGEEGR